MKTLRLLLLTVIASVALCSCSSISVVKDFALTDDGVSKPDDFPILRATGYASISKQSGATAQIKQIKAMRASKLDAYRELSEQLNGIYIKSKNSLNANNVETSSTLKTEAEGYVQGARVIRQYALGDTYATELELDSKVVYDLYQMRGAF